MFGSFAAASANLLKGVVCSIAIGTIGAVGYRAARGALQERSFAKKLRKETEERASAAL